MSTLVDGKATCQTLAYALYVESSTRIMLYAKYCGTDLQTTKTIFKKTSLSVVLGSIMLVITQQIWSYKNIRMSLGFLYSCVTKWNIFNAFLAFKQVQNLKSRLILLLFIRNFVVSNQSCTNVLPTRFPCPFVMVITKRPLKSKINNFCHNFGLPYFFHRLLTHEFACHFDN